jgi:hypothetical protein
METSTYKIDVSIEDGVPTNLRWDRVASLGCDPVLVSLETEG